MKTRAYFAIKIPNRSKNSMLSAIHILTENLPKKHLRHSYKIEVKNLLCYEQVENELNIDFYFADPYSVWQRETNENTNGLLRELFLKKTYLVKISN